MPGHVAVGVGALITVDRKLLMVQRKGSHGAGTWCVPGGWIDALDGGRVETPAQAAEREVLEETGVRVAAYASHLYEVTWPTVDGVHSYCLWVNCIYVEGEPKLLEPEKHSAVEWVPWEDVRDRPLFPHMADYLARRRLLHVWRY